MSREAVEAIEKYMNRRDKGISIAEIKLRIQEYVRVRESGKRVGIRHERYNQNFVIREGTKMKRDKLI